jgi:hypothetical protein
MDAFGWDRTRYGYFNEVDQHYLPVLCTYRGDKETAKAY